MSKELDALDALIFAKNNAIDCTVEHKHADAVFEHGVRQLTRLADAAERIAAALEPQIVQSQRDPREV